MEGRRERTAFRGEKANHLLNFNVQASSGSVGNKFGSSKSVSHSKSKQKVSKRRPRVPQQLSDAFHVQLSANLSRVQQWEILAKRSAPLDTWQAAVSTTLVSDAPLICPICLSDCVIPRVSGTCGHVYCLGCLVQVAKLYGNECCVCHARIANVKPCRIKSVQHIDVGSDVEFQLVVMVKGSFLTLSFDEWRERRAVGDLQSFPAFDSVSAQYCKFSAVWEVQVWEDELRSVDAHIASIRDDFLEQETLSYWFEARDITESSLQEAVEKSKSAHLAGDERGDDASPPAATSLDDFFFVYQCADGQNGFLHPFNMKQLLHRYDRSDLPSRIKCRVVDVFTGGRAEEYHLKHIALNDYHLVECELGRDMLGDAAFRAFDEEARARGRKRAQRSAKARESEKRHQALVQERLAQEARQQRQPLTLLFDEPPEPAQPPVIVINPDEVRRPAEKKYLSYAAIASPHFFEAGSSPPKPEEQPQQQPGARPSFASAVKNGGQNKPQQQQPQSSQQQQQQQQQRKSDPVEPVVVSKEKRGKNYLVLTLGGGTGGRRK